MDTHKRCCPVRKGTAEALGSSWSETSNRGGVVGGWGGWPWTWAEGRARTKCELRRSKSGMAAGWPGWQGGPVRPQRPSGLSTLGDLEASCVDTKLFCMST